MLCEACSVKMEEREATKQVPYPYDLSGLNHVFLIGIVVYVCPHCHAQVPKIPRISELHQVIARTLAERPWPLLGEEIRFLRKQAGFPAQKFAALLSITPEHLSRVENGHTKKLGAQADKLARVVGTNGKQVRELLRKLADERLGGHTEKRKESPTQFKLERKGGWEVAA